MPGGHCCAVGTRLDTSLRKDALMECCPLCSTAWGAVSRWGVGTKAATNIVMSQCKLLSRLLWTQLCSSGLQSALACSNSDHRKWERSGYCICVVCVQCHGRMDFGFHASVLAAWTSINGLCFHVLESQRDNTRNISGMAQCCQYFWDLLVGCLLASPECLAFSPLVYPQKRQEGSSMCQALTWEPDLRRKCPICAVQCNRKTSVRHVMQDKVICEPAYLRWIQF